MTASPDAVHVLITLLDELLDVFDEDVQTRHFHRHSHRKSRRMLQRLAVSRGWRQPLITTRFAVPKL